MPYILLFWTSVLLILFGHIKNEDLRSINNIRQAKIISLNPPKLIQAKHPFNLSFQWKAPLNLHKFNVILSSEQFSQLHLGKNFRFINNKSCFIQSGFTRNKSLSRTSQKFEFIKSPDCTLKAGTLIYSSHAPSSAFEYPLTFQFFDQEDKLINTTVFQLKVAPLDDVFLNCQMIRNKKVSVHCSGLDRFGNATNDNLLVKGTLDYSDQTIDQVINKPSSFIVKNPKDFMRFHYHYKGKDYTSNALVPENFPIYFGDLHTHSFYSDARIPISPAKLFDYAKNVSALDFMAITDHAEGVFGEPLSTSQWQKTIQQVKSFNQNNVFSAFLGFEWTSTFLNPSSPWGHRTIIYPNYDGLPYRSDLAMYSSPKTLYKFTGDVFSYPHHSMVSWGSYDFKMGLQKSERAFEVFSSHGSSEDMHTHITPNSPSGSLHKAIQNTSADFSILAASDTHAGHPGLNNWHKKIHPSMLDGGGLCAVFAKENTKKYIYQSLMERRFYGTSGSRILLIPKDQNQPFPLTVYGSSNLHHLKVISFDPSGHKSFQTIPLEGLKSTITEQEVNLKNSKKFYLQIKQKNDEMAWIGPYKN
ncbi:MAG: DUF3604 domain-containing protein [Candidatus Cloacimonetes bacterium]|nr:DUF3604 domain-containing protein [Candidatus Cloacimonadota bacterium]